MYGFNEKRKINKNGDFLMIANKSVNKCFIGKPSLLIPVFIIIPCGESFCDSYRCKEDRQQNNH